MSTLQRVMCIAATVVSAVGCGQNPSSSSTNPPPHTTSKISNQSPSTANPQAAEDLTPPNVKLAKVDFKLNGMTFTIEAPEGAKVTKPDPTLIAEVLYDKDCCLHISRDADVADETTWWKKGGGYAEPKRFLIEKPDTLLVESKETGERRFVCLTEREVGGVKYTVGLTRPDSARRGDLSTKA